MNFDQLERSLWIVIAAFVIGFAGGMLAGEAGMLENIEQRAEVRK